MSFTPSPEEAAQRLGRVLRFLNLTFEVRFCDGVWRLVRIATHRPIYNEYNPGLSLLVFELQPWVATPYLPEIRGFFTASRAGFERGVVSWEPPSDMRFLSGRVPPGGSVLVPFHATNDDSAAWFSLQLARAAKAKFRQRAFLREDRYIYRREP